MTSIASAAFYRTGLTSISIPNTVKEIGDLVFGGCENLSRVIIKSSETEIRRKAFGGCLNLTNITNLSIIPQKIDNTFDKYDTLHVLPGCMKKYKKADYWKKFTIIEDAIDL